MTISYATGLYRGWSKVACLASGPSLTIYQADQVAAAQERGWRAIVVNNTWQMLSGADAIFAADDRWWRVYRKDLDAAGFAGERWTNDMGVAHKHGLHCVRSMLGAGLPRDPDMIARGGNSGHQAIALAAKFGARLIVLAGYDMQEGPDGALHWHGAHAGGLPTGALAPQIKPFADLASDLAGAGVRVLNGSEETALPYFPRMALIEALECDL